MLAQEQKLSDSYSRCLDNNHSTFDNNIFLEDDMTRNQTLSEGLLATAGILLLIAIAVSVLCSGCASATPQYDTQGNIIGITGYGFLRDLEVSQTKPDGSSLTIKSKSTSADIMKAGNEILGTVTATAAKIAP